MAVGRAGRIGLLLVALGGVLYADWALQLLLDVPSSPAQAPVSALSAPGQPFAWLFRSLDASSGVLVVLGVVLVLAAGRLGAARPPRSALVAAALVGITNVLLALLPEECGEPGAGSGPAPCSDQRLLADPHTVLSLLQDLSVATLAAIVLVGALRARPRRTPLAVLGAVVLLVWTASWLTGGGAFLGDPADGFGWVQRAFVTLTAVLLVALGRSVRTSSRG